MNESELPLVVQRMREYADLHLARGNSGGEATVDLTLASYVTELVDRIEVLREGLVASERAIADAEKVILGRGSIAWVGSLVLEGVRICLRDGRWPDSQECATALADRQERERAEP